MTLYTICDDKQLLSFLFFFSEEKKKTKIPCGAPPAPEVRLSGQKIFEEKFSPFQWTGRWKLATNGGSSRHFYRRLNASKTARESKVERILRLIASPKSGKMVFFL